MIEPQTCPLLALEDPLASAVRVGSKTLTSGAKRCQRLAQKPKNRGVGYGHENERLHFSLDHLSNDDLLSSTRAQVGRSNQVLAGLLAHLRKSTPAVSTGYARVKPVRLCVYELRLSEDAAERRAQAAKIARRFSILFEQIAAGEIHLTGVLMIGPLLTEANRLEVLARAKHRTKRELAGLLRRLDPLPDVPARIEPLGPAPEGRPLQSGTHAQFAAALAGPVRELSPGDRPSDWLEGGSDEAASAEPVPAFDLAETAAEQLSAGEQLTEAISENERLLAPQRYKVQFTASQEYVDLLEQAQDLLAPAVPRRNLEQVHLRALVLLVAELKKRKYAVTERSRSAAAARTARPNPRRRGLSRNRRPRTAASAARYATGTIADPTRNRARGQAAPAQ